MSLTSPIRPLYQAQTYRNLLFLAAGIPIAAVVLGLVIAGWTSIAVLAITPLVVPLLLGYRALVGLLARGDAKLARSLLGVRPDPPAWSEGRGFWGRAKAVVLDPTFWRQQGYLLLRMTLGFAFAVGELALIAAAVSAVTLPIYYRWSAPEYGSWHADSLGRALLHVPVGVAGLVVAAWLARALGSFWAWQVRSLLGPRPAPATADQQQRYRRRALWIDGCTALGLVVLTTIIWAVTGAGYYWPQWVLLPLALLFAIHAIVELVTTRLARRDQALAIHGGVVAALFLFLVAVWALTARGYFWPAWTLLGLGSAVLLHWLITRNRRRDRLSRRVETLETSRLGAVEEQDAELRRIERDLHDGAQARLVALGMSLGMARAEVRVRPGGRPAAGRRSSSGRGGGTEGDARPRPRHLSPGPRRPRDRRGARDAGRPQPVDDDGVGRPARTAACAGRDRGLLRRRRGDGQRGQALRRRPHRHLGRPQRRDARGRDP